MMELREYLVNKRHHAYRRTVDWDLSAAFSAAKLAPEERMTQRFERLCAAETPVLLPGEQICFLRTVANLPDIFTLAEWADLRSRHFIHELGYLSNLSPDYEGAIQSGLLAMRRQADGYGQRAIDAILGLADRYREQAVRDNRPDIAAVLERVPRYGARSFREALQSFRILHFSLWLEGEYHNTVGRFDQYMYPYYERDIRSGVLTEESALALLKDFFLSFNKDSDLYPGVQQGDNGQSLMLGGLTRDGRDGFNALSRLCLLASRDLRLIDPKINLRVNARTPPAVYELGSELTAVGLGFPQYSNDDVVIPGLLELGYAPADAVDYTVAACWEFIIPKVGADVANIAALSLPKVVNTAALQRLTACGSFEGFLEAVQEELQREADDVCEGIRDLWFVPAPVIGLLTNRDIAAGGTYNNFGIHGSGLANAADSLAAIRKYVYEEQTVSKERLLRAMATDFADEEELLHRLRYESPKIGQNDDYVDELGVRLLDMFADALKGQVNCRGGRCRAGTGSAMYYLWHAGEIGASPDGRRKGEPFGANFSVSLFARIGGPLSVISSFAKFHYRRAINGGPLTLEFDRRLFSDDESRRKLAKLVQLFVAKGGHQLQLNVVDAEAMKEAQAHPETYPHMVVRVWGWSAYFVELDRAYQDHVIARQEYRL